MSLRGSPLQHAADRWLDNPSQEDFPASFEAARNLMHMAWLSQTSRLQQSQDVAMVAYTTTTRPGLQQSRQAAVKCLFCDKNHATEDCRLFRLERRDGQTVLVSSEVKKKKPSRQRKARGQSSGLVIRGSVSNSSFSVGSSPLGSTGPALVLDTGTTVNIFKDKSLFTSTSPCDEVVYGVGGDKYQVKLKGTSEWGDALHVPTCPHNLISFRSLVDLDYAGEWSDDSLKFTSRSGKQMVFPFDRGTGLYVCRSFLSTALVVGHFTSEQRKRAVMVTELHERLNHASDDQMVALLESTSLLDTPLTAKDVRISRQINGPCNACVMGKFVNPPSRSSTSTPTSRPGELLHADIAFFQEGASYNRPYLVVVDDFSGFCFCRRLPNKSTTSLGDAVEEVVNEFKAWGHPVSILRSDFEAAPGAHEKRVEIQIRYLRNRFEVVKASLPFNLPTTLYSHLLCDLASSVNVLPNANLPSQSPTSSFFSANFLLSMTWILLDQWRTQTETLPTINQ
jgi:hypothetical protein